MSMFADTHDIFDDAPVWDEYVSEAVDNLIARGESPDDEAALEAEFFRLLAGDDVEDIDKDLFGGDGFAEDLFWAAADQGLIEPVAHW